MAPKTVADELLEVLQAHRDNRLQPPPAPAWEPIPSADEEDDSKESSETS